MLASHSYFSTFVRELKNSYKQNLASLAPLSSIHSLIHFFLSDYRIYSVTWVFLKRHESGSLKAKRSIAFERIEKIEFYYRPFSNLDLFSIAIEHLDINEPAAISWYCIFISISRRPATHTRARICFISLPTSFDKALKVSFDPASDAAAAGAWRSSNWKG